MTRNRRLVVLGGRLAPLDLRHLRFCVPERHLGQTWDQAIAGNTPLDLLPAHRRGAKRYVSKEFRCFDLDSTVRNGAIDRRSRCGCLHWDGTTMPSSRCRSLILRHSEARHARAPGMTPYAPARTRTQPRRSLKSSGTGRMCGRQYAGSEGRGWDSRPRSGSSVRYLPVRSLGPSASPLHHPRQRPAQRSTTQRQTC
eukprot:scaffold158_cov388-Prasinococcus_capsulatus_cf.AAC.12